MRTPLLIAVLLASVQAAQYKTKVAILGAGAAGISAASTLSKNGESDFMVIEAQSFIGGRVQHHAFGDFTVELGANWIYGKGANPIYKLASRHGLKTAPNDKRDLAYYGNHGQIETELGDQATDAFEDVLVKLVDYAEKRQSRDQVDLNSRTALRLVGWEPDTPLKSAVEYFAIDWELAEPAEIASLDYSTGTTDMTEGTFPFGNEFVVDSRGFNHILNKEAQSFLKKNDTRLLLDTTVTHVDYNHDNGVLIKTSNGHEITADYVLCTFSLGVLQSNDVKFTPKFPEWKMEALYSFDMTTYTKIFLRFDHQFWGDWQFALYADSNGTKPDSGYTVWQNLNAPGYFALEGAEKKRDNILMVTTTYTDSHRIERMADTEIMDEITEVLQRMFPDIKVPRPLDILLPRWHSNPLFRGSYSNWPIGMLIEHHDNLRASLPVQQSRLLFAGEAMSMEYGYLHGAWSDGLEAGKKLLQCVKHKRCPTPKYHGAVTGCSNASATFKFHGACKREE